MSVKEAVRVAQSNNLMGLVCSSRLLQLVPALAESIKVAGLVLITDVSDAKGKTGVGAGVGVGERGGSVAAPVGRNFYGIPEGVDGMLEGNAVLRFDGGVDM